MSQTPSHRLAQAAAALLGVGIAAAALLSWQVEAGSGRLDAGVVFSIKRTAKIQVAPEGRFVVARGLRPAGSRAGSVSLYNQTADSLALLVRARSSIPDLDRLLRVRVSAGAQPLFDGRLGDLRRWTRVGPALRSTETRRLQVRVSLPRTAGDGWQGRRVDVALELETEPR